MGKQMDKLIMQLRLVLADNNEPYIFDDTALAEALQMAAGAYSKYNPIKKRGTIKVLKGIDSYKLPDDYQTWLEGLDCFEVLEKNAVLHEKPSTDYDVSFTYLADRQPEEVPQRDFSLLTDYAFYCVVSGEIKGVSEISSIKLGQGLQIQFGSMAVLETLAQKKLENFNEKLTRTSGGWA